MTSERQESTRCCWPLGTSGALSVTCARPKGHDGPHRSSFELMADEAKNERKESTLTVARCARGAASIVNDGTIRPACDCSLRDPAQPIDFIEVVPVNRQPCAHGIYDGLPCPYCSTKLVVTDEMVDRAVNAAFVPPISDDRREDMRRALRAALEAPDA